MTIKKAILFFAAACLVAGSVHAATEATRQYNWVDDKNNSIPITASRMDEEFNNIITKLNQKVVIKSSAPSSPINGMLWFDSTNDLLKQYRNNEWVSMAPIHVSASAPATAQNGDIFYDTDDDLIQAYVDGSWVYLPILEGFSEGAIMLSGPSSTVSFLPVTTAGAIVIGDGTTAPTTLNAFTSQTGQLKHEYGGVEADISAIAKAGLIAGTGTGTTGILPGGTNGYFLRRDDGETTGLVWSQLPIATSGCLMANGSEAAPTVWTEVWDIAGNCSTTTFTVPATGYYYMSVAATVAHAVNTCNASVVINTSNDEDLTIVSGGVSTGGGANMSGEYIVHLDAADTVTTESNTDAADCAYTMSYWTILRIF